MQSFANALPVRPLRHLGCISKRLVAFDNMVIRACLEQLFNFCVAFVKSFFDCFRLSGGEVYKSRLKAVFIFISFFFIIVTASYWSFHLWSLLRTIIKIRVLWLRLEALNRFISRSSDRFKSFFDVLKKAKNFGWTDEWEKVFDQIKKYLSTPPLLVNPKTEQPVGIYLAATESVVSALLFVTDPHEKLV